MPTLKNANKGAADPRFAGPFRIYWLAFLLTGDRDSSVDLAVEALDFEDPARAFFSTWMLAWSRRLVIANALAAIRDQLAASARRMAAQRAEKVTLPPRNWALDRDPTKVQLARALLAIDVFPRCAVLLRVFEGMSLEDAAILLDADRDLVRKAQMTGLLELTRNLARMQGSTSTAAWSYVVTSEMQHA